MADRRGAKAVSVGFGQDGKRLRRKVSGKTKQEVRDKLRALHAELNVGVQSSAGYTVRARSMTGSRMVCRTAQRGRYSCTETALGR